MRKQITDFIVTLIASNPYLIAFFICLFINPFFFGSSEYIQPATINLIAVSLLSFITIINYKRHKAKEISFMSFLFLEIFEIVSILCVSVSYYSSGSKEIWFFIGLCLFLFIAYYYADKTKYKLQITCLFIAGISFALYIYFIMGIPIYQMQHDVGWFSSIGKKGGHAQYIKYIQDNYKLPQGDVSKTWQFAHPPLHHIICAIWLEINEKVFNIDKDRAQESLQILSLFYVMCVIISAYKIFRYFKLTGIPLYCSLAVTSFSPAFILLSVSINNDVLSVAFILGILLNTLYWKKEPNMKNILNIALCLGLGMMTKLSTGAIVPALLVIFISTFIKSQNKKVLLKEFILFLVVALPLGTWFNIKNYISYKIPFNFVHKLDEYPGTEKIYIGNIDYFSRITDFSFNQYGSIYVQNMFFKDSRNDVNPIITLLKCALFGEFIRKRNFTPFPLINLVAAFFLGIFTIISLLSVFSMIYILVQSFKHKFLIGEILFLQLFFFTLILGVYKLSYDYPYVASMNFRYVTPTIIIGQLFLGLFNQNFNILQEKYRNRISIFLASAFAICSIIIYTMFKILN